MAISIFNIVKITHDYKTADTVNKSLQEQFIKPNNIEPSIDPIPEEKITIPISVDFEALKKANDDIVGWIYCPDTPINYPVVKSKDNTQYLRADLNGKYLVSGTIFADYRNKDIGIDSNYIIYGHNMKNGTMFSDLKKYLDSDLREAHKMIEFQTADGVFLFEVTDVIRTNITDERYNQINSTDGRTLALSTCYGSAKSDRLLIIAKEVTT